MTAVQPAAQASPKAFGVWFKDLDLWSPSSFFDVAWHWPEAYIKPLSAALQRKQIEVSRKSVSLESLQLLTLHFDSSVAPRNLRGKSQFKGKLFQAEAGDILYSKIDVRNGAIGIVPDDIPEAAVSSEYPVYRVLTEVAVPHYVQLLFRTAYFQRAINSMISGASGRKRVQPEQIENMTVPLPPLHIQQAIVDRWQQAQGEIADGTARLAATSKDVLTQLRKQLGREVDKQSKPKAFALQWKDLERWGVDMCWQSTRIRSEAHFPLVAVGDLCKVSSGGTPSRKNPNYFKGTIRGLRQQKFGIPSFTVPKSISASWV